MKIPKSVSEIVSVAFQPILHLETGAVYGYQALGRGPAPPSALLDEAAREGWLLALDWLWRVTAIEEIAARPIGDKARFFLNVDLRILEDPSFAPSDTIALLARHNLAPNRFALQLSAHGLSRAPAPLQLVDHFRAQHFLIALDSIGAGFSSLDTIALVRPDIVKLDMTLIRGALHNPLRMEVVCAIIDHCARGDLPLIAEGVEVAEDLRALAQLGIRLGQGFLLGRPIAVVDRPRFEHYPVAQNDASMLESR